MRASLNRLPRGARGVTLIELLIVVVIVAILASIAYPSYQEQVRRTRRADGKTALVNTAALLERCYTRFASYINAECPDPAADSPDGHYAIAAVSLLAQSFTLAATPQGAQASDAHCGVLSLSSAGVQGSQGVADADANGCWER